MAQESFDQNAQQQPDPDAVQASQQGAQRLDSQYDSDQTAGFQTDEVSANRGREQGLGVGERELNAQSDAGVDVAADEEDDLGQAEVDEEDEDDLEELDGSVAVQGQDEEDGAGV